MIEATMISSTSFQIPLDQENQLTNRKANIKKSIRKPLCDRAINHTPQDYGKLTSLKHSEKVQQKQKESKSYPEWFADVCSFKGPENGYDDIDIHPKSLGIDVPNFLNVMLYPKTPPLKAKKFYIPPIQSPVIRRFNRDDDIPEIPIVDVEFPDITF
ncbi:hypothetical protein RI129_006275 [Pyrocoelia pectoralis]|uniref:Uncharacterized protein n=1 Tax=Pyrocoelia pectoralis TaxID=417401 RepID=A0AAN7ZG23_9COLE